MRASSLDLFQDTFPVNEVVVPGIAAQFDTTAALIKTGRNIAPIAFSPNRYDVPGDTALVTASGSNVRVDLVFRIVPGPGNYVTVGHPESSPLRRVPSSTTPIGAPNPGSTNFWESYLGSNGTYGTPGGHGGAWNPNAWNSARCDTAELNFFPADASHPNLASLTPSVYASMYHESDPKIGTLGILKNVCYLINPSGAVTNSNINCGAAVPYPPAWVTGGGTGYPGTTLSREYTKILPDGMFTPGTHVEYFFRKEDGGVFKGNLPDTNVVFPQVGEASLDAHRWQEFSVLPDRWKDTAYRHPVTGSFGPGLPCMLVVDAADGFGDERVWVSVADTTGATAPSRFGAHNGWHAAGGQDLNDPAARVAAHLGQAGTTWDLFQIRGFGSERSGNIGSRNSYRSPNAGMDNKWSRQGPTLGMLNAYYRTMLLLTGPMENSILGPFADQSSDDVGLIESWLGAGSTVTPNRGFIAMGDGFATSLRSGGTAQQGFASNFLGSDERDRDYLSFSANLALAVDLTPSGPLAAANQNFGLRNRCLWTHDVLSIGAGLPALTGTSARYPVGNPLNAPYEASLLKSHSAASPFIALTDGWDITNLTSPANIPNTLGRSRYFYWLSSLIFNGACPFGTAPLVAVGVPEAETAPRADFVRVLNNPLLSGTVRLRFSLARTSRVEARIYDLGGRLVRTLENRVLEAGEHDLAWDGTDDRGHRAARGAYFARVRYQDDGFEAARKLVMLK
jgi:hypothetical protein